MTFADVLDWNLRRAIGTNFREISFVNVRCCRHGENKIVCAIGKNGILAGWLAGSRKPIFKRKMSTDVQMIQYFGKPSREIPTLIGW